MNPALSPHVIQAAQVLTTLLFAPLLGGFIADVEARMQVHREPVVLQTYFDVVKFFRKKSLGAATVERRDRRRARADKAGGRERSRLKVTWLDACSGMDGV